jgi:hypothetical protein
MPLSPYRFFLPYRFAGYLHLSQSYYGKMEHDGKYWENVGNIM